MLFQFAVSFSQRSSIVHNCRRYIDIKIISFCHSALHAFDGLTVRQTDGQKVDRKARSHIVMHLTMLNIDAR